MAVITIVPRTCKTASSRRTTSLRRNAAITSVGRPIHVGWAGRPERTIYQITSVESDTTQANMSQAVSMVAVQTVYIP